MDPVIIAIIVVVVLVVLAIFLHFVPMGLWISALASGVHVSIGSLVGMRIRAPTFRWPLKRPAPSTWPAAMCSRRSR